MNRYLKINEIAKQSGLSKRTIRYYEELGILPAPERSSGGTRLYQLEHVQFLKRITIAKEVLGFSLQELQHFLTIRDTLETQKIDFKKVIDPRERMEKLVEIMESLDDQLDLLEGKIQKIISVQTELVTLKERTRSAMEKINKELLEL